jgi:uncharacterized protein YdeI (YjbR/CyaY-like superfamily)
MSQEEKIQAMIDASGKWQPLFVQLRQLCLRSGMSETIKWGVPVYTAHGQNIVGIAPFKNWIAVWFYQGVFINDTAGVLVSASDGGTKGLRQWRLDKEADLQESVLMDYIRQAIDNAAQGKSIKPAKNTELNIPVELEKALAENETLAQAFAKFSPSHQREYAGYIAEAKREETRLKRLEKTIDMILSNTGLHDKYKKH